MPGGDPQPGQTGWDSFISSKSAPHSKQGMTCTPPQSKPDKRIYAKVTNRYVVIFDNQFIFQELTRIETIMSM
jgi:hypothetical protein